MRRMIVAWNAQFCSVPRLSVSIKVSQFHSKSLFWTSDHRYFVSRFVTMDLPAHCRGSFRTWCRERRGAGDLLVHRKL